MSGKTYPIDHQRHRRLSLKWLSFIKDFSKTLFQTSARNEGVNGKQKYFSFKFSHCISTISISEKCCLKNR